MQFHLCAMGGWGMGEENKVRGASEPLSGYFLLETTGGPERI